MNKNCRFIFFFSSLKESIIFDLIVSADGGIASALIKRNNLLRSSPSTTVKGWSSQIIHFVRNSLKDKGVYF